MSTAETIFAKIDLHDAPDEMVIKLKSCIASPTDDKNSQTQLELFNGDEKNQDIDFEFGLNCQAQTASFNFGAFAFKKRFFSGKFTLQV